MTPSHRCRSGFTLIELAIALVVVTLLASALTAPIAAQLKPRRDEEAQRAVQIAESFFEAGKVILEG